MRAKVLLVFSMLFIFSICFGVDTVTVSKINTDKVDVNKIDVVFARLLPDEATGALVWTVVADPENISWKAIDIAGDDKVAYLPREAIKQIKSFFDSKTDIAQGYHVQPVFFAAPKSKEIKESKSVMEVYHPVVMGKYPLLPDINLSTFRESVEGMGLKILVSRDQKWVTISR